MQSRNIQLKFKSHSRSDLKPKLFFLHKKPDPVIITCQQVRLVKALAMIHVLSVPWLEEGTVQQGFEANC